MSLDSSGECKKQIPPEKEIEKNVGLKRFVKVVGLVGGLATAGFAVKEAFRAPQNSTVESTGAEQPKPVIQKAQARTDAIGENNLKQVKKVEPQPRKDDQYKSYEEREEERYQNDVLQKERTLAEVDPELHAWFSEKFPEFSIAVESVGEGGQLAREEDGTIKLDVYKVGKNGKRILFGQLTRVADGFILGAAALGFDTDVAVSSWEELLNEMIKKIRVSNEFERLWPDGSEYSEELNKKKKADFLSFLRENGVISALEDWGTTSG